MSQFQGSVPLRIRNNPNISEHPHIAAEDVDHEAMVRVTAKLSERFTPNEPYEIMVYGKSAAGQRPRYNLTFTFGSSESCREAWRVLTGD